MGGGLLGVSTPTDAKHCFRVSFGCLVVPRTPGEPGRGVADSHTKAIPNNFNNVLCDRQRHEKHVHAALRPSRGKDIRQFGNAQHVSFTSEAERKAPISEKCPG